MPRTDLQILQIVPRLPPAMSGVGDYAYLLARQLRATHGIVTRFLICEQSWSGRREIDGFRVEQMDGREPRALATQITSVVGDASICLHYVGYGYQKRGCPLWLVRALELWKEKNPAGRLLVMFHELYAFAPPWRSSFWNSPLQRLIAARLARLAEACRSSYRSAAGKLERMAPKQTGRVVVFPVFSNLGEPSNVEALRARPPRAVIYSAGFTGASAARKHQRDLERACHHLGIEEVVFFGEQECMLDIPGIRSERCRALSAEAANTLLSRSRVGILDYNLRCLGKSGVFAAYCAHGMLPLLASSARENSNELQAGKEYLLASDLDQPLSLVQQEQVANHAHAWYQQHDLPATASSFAATLREL